eukprot:1161512-Pelagomonas_calceolata.AAC.26
MLTPLADSRSTSTTTGVSQTKRMPCNPRTTHMYICMLAQVYAKVLVVCMLDSMHKHTQVTRPQVSRARMPEGLSVAKRQVSEAYFRFQGGAMGPLWM